MKRIICILAAFAMLCLSFALAERTVYASQSGVCVYEENALFGLMDEDGNILLPAEYDWIFHFGDQEYIPLMQDGRYGYARRDGSIAAECIYENIYICKGTHLAHAFTFENENVDELLIDLSTGEILLSEPLHNYNADENYIYDLSVGANDGWAVTGPFSLSVYDHDLNLMFKMDGAEIAHPFAGGFVIYHEEGFYSVVGPDGNTIIGDLDTYRIVDGELYYSRFDKSPISGILRADGSRMEVFADKIQPRDEMGFCRAQTGGLWGYIDQNGEWVISPAYNAAYPFVEGAAVVQREDGMHQLIDEGGRQIGDAEWRNGMAFELPLIPIEKNDVRLLNRRGEYVGEVFRRSLPWTTDCCDIFAGHLLLADGEGRICVVDMEANVIARLYIHDFSSQNVDGAMWAKKTGKWGLIDVFGENAGQWIIEPGFDFESVYRYEAAADAPYYGTNAAGTEGLFDMYGNHLLPPRPEDLYD